VRHDPWITPEYGACRYARQYQTANDFSNFHRHPVHYRKRRILAVCRLRVNRLFHRQIPQEIDFGKTCPRFSFAAFHHRRKNRRDGD
jgi:hypothetical protein